MARTAKTLSLSISPATFEALAKRGRKDGKTAARIASELVAACMAGETEVTDAERAYHDRAVARDAATAGIRGQLDDLRREVIALIRQVNQLELRADLHITRHHDREG